MDISQAKEQIKQCVEIYLAKDAFGVYTMPVERQRPVFLLGAPGIGKTAIMEQIAQELALPLVTYSMTHHTRQSALGLPMIREKTYQGLPMSVTGYTLSEIIVEIYETMEKTGRKEGILFLDEINCVSETLAPAMLQFLQYKTFGNHKIPEGWVIVTAGNPPQYNRSVREFDIVTLDRLKVMQIEPEYEAWSRYAKAKGLHPAVRTYLDLHRDDFYILETTKTGRQYVTARGWEDLAEAILLYESKDFTVDEALVGQYLRHERICTQFTMYYRLYRKYKDEYGIRAVLEGAPQAAAVRFANAGVDEKITVTQLFSEVISSEIRTVQEQVEGVRLIRTVMEELREQFGQEDLLEEKTLAARNEALLCRLENARQKHEQDPNGGKYLTAFCRSVQQTVSLEPEENAFALLEQKYSQWTKQVREDIKKVSSKLEQAFAFFEEAGSNHEMVIFMTNLSVNEKCSRFIFDHPSEGYLRNSSLLALGERKNELLRQLGDIES